MSSAAEQAQPEAHPWRLWQKLLFGQLLAAILAMCGISSTALASRVRLALDRHLTGSISYTTSAKLRGSSA